MENRKLTMKRARVLLGDDHAITLEGVRRILEPHFEVVGTAADGRALIAAAQKLHPDVIVADISMPVMNGFQAARQLRKVQPDARILFLTVHEEPVAVTEALAIGVSGYVLKRAAADDLIPALREVLQGGRFVSETLQQ